LVPYTHTASASVFEYKGVAANKTADGMLLTSSMVWVKSARDG
jgi:hypothetical protein